MYTLFPLSITAFIQAAQWPRLHGLRARLLLACIAIAAICPFKSLAAEASTLVVPPWGVGGNNENPFFKQLLALVFAKTEAEDGPVRLKVYPQNLSSARFMADVKNNARVDVIWNGTTRQREQEMRPIYISLLKELNDYRVLLIRKEDQEKFNQVTSLEDLRKFTAGSGADWPSTEMLLLNDLPVVKVNSTALLFPMLKAKRFDYMARNLSEAWDEANSFEKEGLVIESNLLLKGGVPFYFFVSKENENLARRIERGLRLAIADGSFDELFLAQEGFRQGEAVITDPHRRVLQLKTE